MENNYNVYLSQDDTLKRRRDAGTVLSGRRSQIGEVRETSSAKFERAMRDKLSQQNEDARNFSEEDDMIFYPTGGKNLPHSEVKQEMPATKVPARTQRQHLKVNTDPARVAANLHTHEALQAQINSYDRSASHNTVVSDYTQYYSAAAPHVRSRTPNTLDAQHFQASPPEEQTVRRTRACLLSDSRNSQLKPESPAFSYTPQSALGDERTHYTNSLLQILTQSQASQAKAQQDAATAADMAARLNESNKVAQHRDSVSSVGSNFEHHQGTPQQPRNYSDFDLGTYNADGSHHYFVNQAYQGATVSRFTQHRTSDASNGPQPRNIHGHGDMGSGDNEVLPLNFRGRNYGQHQGM
jgi:hypothetical protein